MTHKVRLRANGAVVHPISDHALIRWMDRVHGVPMETFRADLEETVRSALGGGTCRLVRDGFVYVIDRGYLVTVKPK